MKVTAYLWVSTDKQAEQGLGLNVQRKAIAAWAHDHGHKVASWHVDEGISGSNGLDTRDGLRLALREVRQRETGGIVFYRLDRLARDLILQETLLREIASYGARAFSTFASEQDVMENDAGDPSRKLIRHILGAVADYERDLIRLRLSNGRRAKHERGGYAYGGPPYGWQAEGGKLVPDPDEQAVRARMRERREAGRSLREIADALNAEGLPARRGRWHAQTVARALERTGEAVAKYDPLRRVLGDSGKQEIDLGMAEIAAIVDGGLPPSAYRQRMWWANTSPGQSGHVQARAWQKAGYEVTSVDFAARRVWFRRKDQ